VTRIGVKRLNSRMPRLHGFLLLLVGTSVGHAAQYSFTPLPASGTARVHVRLVQGAGKEFRMPAWAPGDYELLNYGRFVETVEFKKAGSVVESEHSTSDVNLWTIPAGADEVTYEVKPSRGNFSPNLRVTAEQAFVSGPGVFGWFEGDQRNRQTLHIALQPAGAQAFTTLDPVPSAKVGFASFEAYDYDEMLDAPFVVGNGVRSQAFEVRGKPMKVVAFNRSQNADLASFVRVGTAVAQGCYDLFGELPYPRYTFYCDFGGGGGGLEHLNSCRLGLGTGSNGENSVGFIFHEFVHCYNVKRIRPKVLGPFDYTKPAKTATIWWLEGVTDYFADVLAVRQGYTKPDQFLSRFGMGFANFGRNPNRLKISADESSLRVWETRGSGGFGGVNYYEKGSLIGACLDLAIRGYSNGKFSLDNVIRDLYQETKNRQPGYGEDRIRELCIKYGGAKLGPLYDACARKAVELPIAEAAAAAGLTWDGSSFAVDPSASPAQQAVARRYPLAIQKPE